MESYDYPEDVYYCNLATHWKQLTEISKRGAHRQYNGIQIFTDYAEYEMHKSRDLKYLSNKYELLSNSQMIVFGLKLDTAYAVQFKDRKKAKEELEALKAEDHQSRISYNRRIEKIFFTLLSLQHDYGKLNAFLSLVIQTATNLLTYGDKGEEDVLLEAYCNSFKGIESLIIGDNRKPTLQERKELQKLCITNTFRRKRLNNTSQLLRYLSRETSLHSTSQAIVRALETNSASFVFLVSLFTNHLCLAATNDTNNVTLPNRVPLYVGRGTGFEINSMMPVGDLSIDTTEYAAYKIIGVKLGKTDRYS
jgi:hypothetical protein